VEVDVHVHVHVHSYIIWSMMDQHAVLANETNETNETNESTRHKQDTTIILFMNKEATTK
jgi:hypothetical protein